jgi:hypothetical protein
MAIKGTILHYSGGPVWAEVSQDESGLIAMDIEYKKQFILAFMSTDEFKDYASTLYHWSLTLDDPTPAQDELAPPHHKQQTPLKKGVYC